MPPPKWFRAKDMTGSRLIYGPVASFSSPCSMATCLLRTRIPMLYIRKYCQVPTSSITLFRMKARIWSKKSLLINPTTDTAFKRSEVIHGCKSTKERNPIRASLSVTTRSLSTMRYWRDYPHIAIMTWTTYRLVCRPTAIMRSQSHITWRWKSSCVQEGRASTICVMMTSTGQLSSQQGGNKPGQLKP